jgi:hypothetical protein
MQPSALDSADVNENISATIVRLNKSKAFLAVEPLNSTCSHFYLQSCSEKARKRGAVSIEMFGRRRRKCLIGEKAKSSGRKIVDDSYNSGLNALLQTPGRPHPAKVTLFVW